ncbi:MAG TPA: host attachment protein [Steroidobacteraceae bacterium]
MRIRVIVADPSEARFYDLDGISSRLSVVCRLVDPQSPPQVERDVAAASETNARRAPPTPRVPGSELRPRKDAAMRFARQIAAELSSAKRDGAFDRLVLVAGPAFIGLLRSALPEAVRMTLVAEVRKDLVAADEETIGAALPPEAFG